MSVHSGPDIQTTGLIFSYDMLNTVRSNIGEPTTNLISNPVPTSTTGYSAAGGTGTLTFDATSNSIRWYRTGYEVWGAYLNTPTAFNGTLSTSAQYSMSFEWKSEGQVNSSALSYQLVQGNGVSPASASYSLNSNSVDIGNGWKKFKATFTPLNTGVGDAYNRVLVAVVNPSTSILDFYIRKVQFEQKSYATTFVNGTRSDTQAILDLTNNTTVIATSLTYASDSTFSFNGTSNYISMAQPAIGLTPNNWTITGWIRPTSATESVFLTPQSAGIDHMLRYDGVNKRLGVQVTESADINNRGYYTASNSVLLNTWTHFSVSINNLTIKTYINSVESLNQTESIAIANWDGVWTVGQRGNSTFWYAGQISTLQVYNRALTATEVRQNFNATRSRYGV
jgi:hypothetical protein